MQMTQVLAIGILGGLGAVSVPVQASTVISITGNDIGGVSVEGGVQVIAQGWSTSIVYNDVTITADLDTVSPTGADLIAYLMTQIGPGTTTTSQVALTPGLR